MDTNNDLDIFSPTTIVVFIIAFVGDATFILIVTHYFCGIVIAAILWRRLKGFVPKAMLAIGILIPMPFFLLMGVFFSILFTKSKLAEELAEAAALAGAAIVTGGAAVPVEGAVIAGETAEGAAVLAEAGEGAIAAGETATTTAEVEGGVAAGVETEGAAAEAEGLESDTERLEDKNTKPSEQTTERDSTKNKLKEYAKDKAKEQLQSGGQGEEEDEDETEEQRQQAAAEEIMAGYTPDEERDPVEVAEEQELGNVVPINSAKKKLEDRWAKNQAEANKHARQSNRNDRQKAA